MEGTANMPSRRRKLFPARCELVGSGVRGQSGQVAFPQNDAVVALVSGDAFGADAYIRLSYATSMENIIKGLDRIEQAAGKLA